MSKLQIALIAGVLAITGPAAKGGPARRVAFF